MLFWEPFGLEGGWSRDGSALGGSARWVPFNGADAITVFHQSSFLFRECLDQNVRPLCHGVNLARFGAWTRSAVRARHLTSFHISRGPTTPQATWLRTPASPPLPGWWMVRQESQARLPPSGAGMMAACPRISSFPILSESMGGFKCPRWHWGQKSSV